MSCVWAWTSCRFNESLDRASQVRSTWLVKNMQTKGFVYKKARVEGHTTPQNCFIGVALRAAPT
jgi:hypothetical protein